MVVEAPYRVVGGAGMRNFMASGAPSAKTHQNKARNEVRAPYSEPMTPMTMPWLTYDHALADF